MLLLRSTQGNGPVLALLAPALPCGKQPLPWAPSKIFVRWSDLPNPPSVVGEGLGLRLSAAETRPAGRALVPLCQAGSRAGSSWVSPTKDVSQPAWGQLG